MEGLKNFLSRQVIILIKLLKKSMSVLDFLIIVVALFMFEKLDYSNLETSDIIYMVAFGLWILMLFVRIFIVKKNDEVEK